MDRLPLMTASMSLLLLIVTSALSVPVSLAEESCRVKLPTHLCPDEDPECFQKLECRHGRCEADAGCICDTCWTGTSCHLYVDEFGPTFPIRDVYHQVLDTEEGRHYHLQAYDADLGSTCPLGVSGPPARCPCAVIGYRLLSSDVDSDVISLDTETGVVTVLQLDQLTPGKHYKLQLEAHAEPPVDADLRQLHRDAMNLTLFRPVNVDEQLLAALKEADDIEKDAEDEVVPLSTQLEEKPRAKRDAPGATPDTTQMTLSRTDGAGTSPKIGADLNYEFKISVPAISNMDMKVEIFVADLDTGDTAFHIYEAAVTTVGSGVSSDLGDLTSLSFTEHTNAKKPQYVDRMVLDLGSLSNSAPTSGGASGDSDILIAFKVVVIHNTDISGGSTQYVSAGAEYNSANYVWVANDQFTPDTTSTDISSSVGTAALAAASADVTQFQAGVAQLTLPVVAATAETYVEAFLVHQGVSEESLNLGGAWVELGDKYLAATKKFGGDQYTNQQVRTPEGRTTFKSFTVPFKQLGGSSAASSDPGRELVVKLPVYANGNAKVGGKATLVVFVKTLDLMTGSDIDSGTSHKFEITIVSGSPPAQAGSMPDLEKFSEPLESASLDVVTSSTVSYLVKATFPSDASIATQAITLDTSSTDLQSCAVDVYSQGVNVVNLELGGVDVSQSNTAVLTLNNIITTEVTTESAGYDVVFRVAVRADGSGGEPSVSPGSLSLDAVNSTGSAVGTEPTVAVSASGATTVNIGQMFALDITIDYPVDDLYEPSSGAYDVEFASDLRLDYEVKFCSAHVISVGRDIPCAKASLASGLSTTFSKTNTSREYDNALATTLPRTCSSNRAGQTAPDRKLTVRATAQVMPGQTLGATDFKPGAGLEFSTSTLYAGLVDLTLASALTSASGDTPVLGGPAGPIPLTFGKVHAVDITVYMPPGASTPMLTVKAQSSDPTKVRVDRVVVRKIGENLACLEDRLVNADQLDDPDSPPSYPAFMVEPAAPDGVLGDYCELRLGPVTNVGSTSDAPSMNTQETTLKFVGRDHLVLSVLIQGLVGEDGTAPGDISDVTLDVTGTADGSAALTALSSIALAFSALDTRFSAGDGSTAPTMQATGRTDDTIYKGVPKVVDVKVDIPENFYGTLKVVCEGPGASDEWEAAGAAAVRHGENVAGIWPTDTKPEVVSAEVAGMTLGQSATLTLWDVTWVGTVKTALANSTEMGVACVYNVPTASSVGDSSTLSTSVRLLDGADAEITSSSVSLTVAADYTADPSVIDLNETVVLNTTVPTGSIGEYIWVPFQIVIPPGAHRAELAVVSDSNNNRAFFTMHDFKFGTKIGNDVLGLPQLMPENINLTVTNTNISHVGQKDTILIDLGVLTNLGLSQELYRGVGGSSEWTVDVEVYIRITDHPTLRTTATQKLSISFALGDSTIHVARQDVTTSVLGTEKILLDTLFTLADENKKQYDKESDKRVAFSVTLQHNNDSRLEGENARAVIIFPPYMTYENGSAQFNSSSLTVLFKGSSVALVVGEMWFDDVYTITFAAEIDPTFVRGRGSGYANATTIGRAICKPTLATNAFARCGPMSFVMYEVMNPECSEELLAPLSDCHFSASASVDSTGAYTPAGVKASGWRPPVRDDPAWARQYLQVMFGVPTRVSGWKITNIGNRAVTEIALEASNDGNVFSRKFEGAVTTGEQKALLANSFNARYVRLVILAAGPETNEYIHITAELYGCHTDPNLPVEDTCPSVVDNTIYTTAAHKWRHFAVDTTNSIVYYCDYDLSKEMMLCFASADDGEVWVAQPKYLGELRGHADGKMYAYDSKRASTMASEDGKHWQMVDDADVPSSLDDVTPVPGYTEAETTLVSQGGWEGDYLGLKKSGGPYLVKWGKCCGN